MLVISLSVIHLKICVVVLKDIIMEREKLYLVFELIDMDLKNLMDQSDEPLSLNVIKSYTAQIFSGF